MNELEAFRQIYRIRKVEEVIAIEYPKDQIRCPVHQSTGQEWISVAVCSALDKNDDVVATYRSHAAYLAKGGSMQKLFDELYGLPSGCCGGWGGSMHLCDMDVNFHVTSAIVGTTTPLALGLAFARKYNGQEGVVVNFIGDGATECGSFWESLNFALLYKLPLLIVVENNKEAIYTGIKNRQAGSGIAHKVQSFGIDSMNYKEGELGWVAKTTADVIKSRSFPFLLEVECARWQDHVGVDKNPIGFDCQDILEQLPLNMATNEIMIEADREVNACLLETKKRLEQYADDLR